jgi:hypothetical protein
MKEYETAETSHRTWLSHNHNYFRIYEGKTDINQPMGLHLCPHSDNVTGRTTDESLFNLRRWLQVFLSRFSVF